MVASLANTELVLMSSLLEQTSTIACHQNRPEQNRTELYYTQGYHSTACEEYLFTQISTSRWWYLKQHHVSSNCCYCRLAKPATDYVERILVVECVGGHLKVMSVFSDQFQLMVL